MTEAAAMAALEAGQIPAADLYRAVLDDRGRLLEEIAGMRKQVNDLKQAILLGQELAAVMEGQG